MGISIRERTAKDGTISFFLDIYTNGERTYEGVDPKIPPKALKAEAKRIRGIVETLRTQRAQEVEGMSKSEMHLGRATLDKFIDATSAGNYNRRAVRYFLLKTYDSLPQMKDITPVWLEEVQHQMREDLKDTSAFQYFNTLRGIIRLAYKRGVITADPTMRVKAKTPQPTQRQFLTEEEIESLKATPYRRDLIKRSFIFSIYTGIRISDLRKIRWHQIEDHREGKRLVFRQTKTKGVEYLPLHPKALEMMGESGEPDDLIFPLKGISRYNDYLREWAVAAGINKHITWHSARHTFAVLGLTRNNSLYTISQLLGHKNLATTQRYLHITDKAKLDAILSL